MWRGFWRSILREVNEEAPGRMPYDAEGPPVQAVHDRTALPSGLLQSWELEPRLGDLIRCCPFSVRVGFTDAAHGIYM